MSTPLLNIGALAGISKLFIKDESTHPTGTFKDRLAAAALRQFPPGTSFGAISYGNTALSFAHAIRRAKQEGLHYRFVAFIPQDMHEWNLGPSSYGNCRQLRWSPT